MYQVGWNRFSFRYKSPFQQLLPALILSKNLFFLNQQRVSRSGLLIFLLMSSKYGFSFLCFDIRVPPGAYFFITDRQEFDTVLDCCAFYIAGQHFSWVTRVARRWNVNFYSKFGYFVLNNSLFERKSFLKRISSRENCKRYFSRLLNTKNLIWKQITTMLFSNSGRGKSWRK